MATIPASENEYPSLLLVEGAAPGTPAAGLIVAYAKAGGVYAWKDDGGTEHIVGEGDVTAHLADTTDAHDASAISFSPTGTIAATDVQAAIAEVASEAAASGPFTLAVASQHDITSTTATEVTLTPTPTLGAGTYMFVAHILLRSASTTNGPRIGLNFTGTQTLLHAVFHYEGNAVTASAGSMATPGGVPFGHIHESGSAASATTTSPNMGPDGIQTTGTNVMAVIQGIIVVTVSGDFELWHGCESGASQTSVMAGSSILIVKTA